MTLWSDLTLFGTGGVRPSPGGGWRGGVRQGSGDRTYSSTATRAEPESGHEMFTGRESGHEMIAKCIGRDRGRAL